MNNPPAFPYSFPDGPHDNYSVAYGMTLRDYFAAKAMQAFLQEYVHDNSDAIADKAYKMADAMLKAREA